jgi:hypothetical protein
MPDSLGHFANSVCALVSTGTTFRSKIGTLLRRGNRGTFCNARGLSLCDPADASSLLVRVVGGPGSRTLGSFRVTQLLPTSPTPSRRPNSSETAPWPPQRTVDGHRPEPTQNVGSAAGLIDAADLLLASVEGVVWAVLIDPGAKAGWVGALLLSSGTRQTPAKLGCQGGPQRVSPPC